MRLNPFRRRSRRSTSREGWLRPETKRAIVGVLLLVFSLVAVLSFFQAAGPTGKVLLAGLRVTFGWLAYGVPVALVVLGVHLLRPNFEPLLRLRWIGILLLTIGLLGLFHVVGVEVEDAYQVALDGRGGGVLGFMFSFPLGRATSSLAAGILFAASFLIGFFLAFNLALADAWRWLSNLMPSRGDGSEAEADEGDLYEEDERGGGGLPMFRVSSMRSHAHKPDPAQLKLQEDQEREQHQRVRQQLKAANRRYQPPSLELLHLSVGRPDSGNVEGNKKKIQTTLEEFGIIVAMGKVSIGPTVTQYTLRPNEGVKLSRITALQNDLALALAASSVRIEAPIPGTPWVGVEIPNKDVSLVRLRDLLMAKEFRRSEVPLTLAMGKDVAGRVVATDLERMPHLLIAGATGAGKSIFINTLILSLVYRNSPSLVKFILVDPKRVELSVYNDIPHLLTPVIVESEKTINALKWAVRDMDRRYRVLSESGARNLLSFNTNNPDEAMPMIVIIIDELADLMSKHARDVEGAIVRLSQMARAVGIHLVLATQRPSVNVLTGLIKANIPTRVAFNVASQVDSRTILDASGAEKLLGSGDMLFLPGDRAKPVRLQGGFVSEDEVRQVVADLQSKNPVTMEYQEVITDALHQGAAEISGETGEDQLLEVARDVVVQSGKASASLLQRRLRVGYARAARLLDMLEQRGVIGPGEGNKPREILVASSDVPVTDELDSHPREKW